MDYNIREMTIGDYEKALTLTICDPFDLAQEMFSICDLLFIIDYFFRDSSCPSW